MSTVATATMELLSQALEPLCEKIIEKLANEHKIEVTMEWLMDAMTLPYQAKTAVATVSAAKPATRTFKPGDGKTGCMYVFTKGASKGNYCGKKTEDGSNFCKQCAKKGSAQKSADDGAAPRAVSPVKRSLTMERKSKADTLNLERRGDGTFLHKPTNLILEGAPRGRYKAIAKLEGEEELELEDQDREEATKLGFITDNQAPEDEDEPDEKESQSVPGAVTMNGLSKPTPKGRFSFVKKPANKE